MSIGARSKGLTSRRAAACLATLAAAIPTAAQTAAATPLPALNSYAQPPFVIAGRSGSPGLAASFLSQLNEALGLGRRHFSLEVVPRRRLELALSNPDFSGIGLFMAPEFLAPAAQQGGAWSAPIMVDENILVSLRPLKLASLDDLHRLRLGGIAGHIYRVLGPLIDAGSIQRDDAVDHIANLKKLCLGRVDFVVISRSELAGTEPQARCEAGFQQHPFPEPQVIVRRVLVRVSDGDEAAAILGAISAVACSDSWAQALSRLGLSTAGCRSRDARPRPGGSGTP